jgi:glycosyltransferase involved in cell wall biosynthesis
VKLALVSQHYPPDFEGGSEVAVRALARGLARLGHDVRVIAGTDRAHSGADVVRERVDGIPVSRLPRRELEIFDLELARPRLVELAVREAEGAEVVHVHHWSTLSQRLVRALATHAPVVVSLWDLFATCPRFFRLSPVAGVACPPRGEVEPCARCVAPAAPGVALAELETRLAARARDFDGELAAAAAILAPSEAHAQRLAPLLALAPERLRVLRPGLPRPLRRRPRTLPSWRGERALRVLHFGNLCEEKGTLDLVQALAALPSGSVELELAGRPVGPGVEARAQRSAGATPVRFSGSFDAVSLEELAAGADLAAFPSRAHESYGLVLDEAHALGLPAWVSDRGALRERVGRAGRVLPAEDPPAWTKAFRELLERPAELEIERAAVPARLPTSDDSAREHAELYARIRAEWRR